MIFFFSCVKDVNFSELGLLGMKLKHAILITRWGTCVLASIGFGTHGGCQIVVDSHKIEY
jgi:hypothetical protein